MDLDEVCRRQQLGEGWFPTLEDVPGKAISMSIHQMLKSKKIICTVPGEKKADAVKKMLEGDISPAVPAAILRNHPDTSLYLDPDAASNLVSPPGLDRA